MALTVEIMTMDYVDYDDDNYNGSHGGDNNNYNDDELIEIF